MQFHLFYVCIYLYLFADITIPYCALQELYEVISSDMTKQLDGIFIIAGDFNNIPG